MSVVQSNVCASHSSCLPTTLTQAKERRDGINPDYQDMDDTVALTSGYKTMAPLAEA